MGVLGRHAAQAWLFKLELLMCAWLEAIIPALSSVPVSCTAVANSQ